MVQRIHLVALNLTKGEQTAGDELFVTCIDAPATNLIGPGSGTSLVDGAAVVGVVFHLFRRVLHK
ncbi:hypothetical protein EON65_49745 [archaeon]|nr:MAG: hypothetical protein EON65_49745 [archaeon]